MNDPEIDDDEALALLASALPAVEPPPSARADLLAELRGPLRYAPFASEVAHKFSAPLEAVLAAFARIDDDSAWLGSASSKARILPIAGRVVISRLAHGLLIPKHTHALRELTYVLDGVLVADGVAHGAGSCMDMPPGTAHAVEVGGEHDCLAVFAEGLA